MSGGGPQRKRPAKHKNPLDKAQKCLNSGRFHDTRHAVDQKTARIITLPEVRMIIENGYWEKRKDEYKPEYEAWNYSIRGRTVDGRDLRIIISFENQRLLFITTIDKDN